MKLPKGAKNLLIEEQIPSFKRWPLFREETKTEMADLLSLKCSDPPLTLLHSEQPKLYRVLAVLAAIELTLDLPSVKLLTRTEYGIFWGISYLLLLVLAALINLPKFTTAGLKPWKQATVLKISFSQ